MILNAPVPCTELVRVILSITVPKRFTADPVGQLDVEVAFVWATLPKTENIWIELPNIDGIEQAHKRLVKIRMYHYGILQAPRL